MQVCFLMCFGAGLISQPFFLGPTQRGHSCTLCRRIGGVEKQTLEVAYAELASVILWIDESGKVLDIPGDDRSKISAAILDTVLEHQAAVSWLVYNKLNGSALAMLRVAAEAFIRGMWIARCASDEDIACFKLDRIKRLTALVEDVEKSLGNATDTLSNMIRNQWRPLSGFTHTGFQQVTRRYTGPNLTPNYPDEEIVQALRFASAIGLLAAVELAVLSGNTELAEATLARARQEP